jgi:hypothetical protein
MNEQTFWIVHFFEEDSKYAQTEELVFPTNKTKENIEAAIEKAKEECEVNGYKFACLDLIESNWTKPHWCFPKDLECFE